VFHVSAASGRSRPIKPLSASFSLRETPDDTPSGPCADEARAQRVRLVAAATLLVRGPIYLELCTALIVLGLRQQTHPGIPRRPACSRWHPHLGGGGGEFIRDLKRQANWLARCPRRPARRIGREAPLSSKEAPLWRGLDIHFFHFILEVNDMYPGVGHTPVSIKD
jgi:hypothetical protein